MRKRVWSLFLCLAMLASMVPAVYAEGAVDTGVELSEIVPDDGIAAVEPQEPAADDAAVSPVEADAPNGPTEPIDNAEEPGDADPSAVGADALGGPTEADGEEAPAENIDAVPAESPVRVVFVCEPEETAITVYDPAALGENGEPVAIEAEADGSFLLLPGKYCYDAAAEGFAPLEKVEFTVEATEGDILPREIRVTLEAAPASEADRTDDPAEEPEEEADPAEADDGENEGADGAEDALIGYASGSVVASGSCGTSATYTLYSDGELVISGTGAIENNAFENDKLGTIQKLTIQSGITSIGGSAFKGCGSLIRVTIPASVTSIGSYAFNNAGALQTVTLEEGLQSIGYQAFHMCSALDGIQLPSTLTSIGGSAFRECRQLTSITIPGNVTSVGVAAFRNCEKLQSVTLADGVPTVSDQMFYNCTSLTNVTIGNAVSSIGTQAFYGCNKLPNVLIPSSVTSIGLAAFYNAERLESVTLSEGLQTIGYRAFYNCRSLKSIAVPGSVTELRDNAFANNYALKSITFAGDAPSVIQPNTFDGVTADAYYNSNHSGWTDEKRENYGGTLTWIDVGNLFVVSYDANGGTGAPESQIKTRGVSLQLSSVVPTRGDVAEGSFTVTFDANGGSTDAASLTAAHRQSFVFQNWNTAADGSGTAYASGGAYTADADATLYAQWNTQSLVDTIQLPSATRDGHTLAGWSTSASAAAAEFQPGAMYTPNSDLTLYAVWQSDPVSAFVQRAYSLILEREPDEQGLSDWVNALRSGSVTGATLVNGFVCSPEFLNRGLDNETVATILYHVMLNRSPDASGRDLWAGYLNNGMSYTFIVNGFAGSPEFRGICSSYGIDPGFVTLTESRDQNPKVTAFVSRNYRLILERVPDAGGLNAWTSALLSGTQTGAAVVNGFVLSPEFISRGLPSDKVVEILYAVMLDRVPDANGKAVWVDYLNQGHSYTDLVNGFAGSAEFQGICADAGITAGWA